MAGPMVPACRVTECVAIVQSVKILGCEFAVGDPQIISELPLGGSLWIVSAEPTVVAPRFAVTRKTSSAPNVTRMSGNVTTTGCVITVACTGMKPGTMGFTTAVM